MKRILFAAFAASLLAAGCQKTEVVESNNGPVITFSTEMKKITKADPKADAEGDANLHAQGFKIWAYADFSLENVTNVETNPDNPKYLIYDNMYSWPVTYTEAAGWSAGGDYYWPGTKKSLRFFAVSTKNEYTVNVTNGIEPKTNPSNPSITISNFEVTDGNEDLMVADFHKQHQNQDSRVVNLDFHHTLTKVEFKFKTTVPTDLAQGESAPKVFVQKLELNNLNYKGELTASANTNFASPSPDVNTAEELTVQFVWNPAAGIKSFVSNGPTGNALTDEDSLPAKIIGIDGNEINTSGQKAPLLKAEAETYATWLMLPHTSIVDAEDNDEDNDKLIVITYVIDDRQFEAKFPLAGKKADGSAQIPSWNVNQYITYTIDLSPNMISFDASSSDWTNFDGDSNPNEDTNKDGNKTNDDINMNN